MAIHAAGTPLTATQIATEFPDATPYSLSEFLRGGAKVPNGPTANANIPTTNSLVKYSGYLGSANRVTITLNIPNGSLNYNIFANRGISYIAGITDITVYISSGFIIGSANVSTEAITTGLGWAAGDVVTIINHGYIIGKGGTGGAGACTSCAGNSICWATGFPGSSGGPALRIESPTGATILITNNGVIGGGGGGGSGAGAYKPADDPNYCGSGGGGGAGYGTGGAGTGSSSAGSTGTAIAGGAGGTIIGAGGGFGGAGGALGASGGVATGYGSTVGSAGAATIGATNALWVIPGTRLGAIT